MLNEGVQGITPLATTGESPVLSDYEYEKLLKNRHNNFIRVVNKGKI